MNNEKKTSDLTKQKKEEKRTDLTILLYVGIIAAICILWGALVLSGKIFFEGKEKTGTALTESKTVILTEKQGNAVATITETEEKTEEETEPVLQSEENELPETENIRELYEESVFGQPAGVLDMAGEIRIAGLNNAQKEEFKNYKESDLIKAACYFLSQNGYKTVSKIEFMNKIECSSENAVAYEAIVNEDTEKILNIIYYPELSRYLFTLQNAKIVTVKVKETEQSTEAALPAGTTTSGESSRQSETVIAQTEAVYDASSLSVQGIPATLLNYIDNRYELQYSLYNYLYNNGYRTVTSAEIEGYSIDPDTREAVFAIQLNDSNNTMLQGVYDKNNNSYLYME